MSQPVSARYRAQPVPDVSARRLLLTGLFVASTIGGVAASAFGIMGCASDRKSGHQSEGQIGRGQQALTPSWIGTWATSPENCGRTFSKQTLRQIVRTSIGGTSARLQFSNVLGSQSVTLRDVHIANRTSNAAIDAASDHAVTFNGQASTTIPAGDVAVSDAVDFAVAPLSDVVISAYFPQSTSVETCHQDGLQTNYIAAGDVSGDADLGNPDTADAYYLLANLDVQNPKALGAVVAVGASITDGLASNDDQNHRWPNFLAERLAAAGLEVGVLNQGISGNRLLADGSGPSLLSRFARDVLAQPGARWVIISDDPINDLGDTQPVPSANDLTQGLTQLITSAHQAGVKVLCSTLTPFEGAGYWSSQGEAGRGGFDAFVLGSGSGCDAIVDQDLATHDPAHPTQFLPADDSGDHLHPSDDGRRAIANAVPFALFTAAPASADGGSTPTPVDAASSDAASNGQSSTTNEGGLVPTPASASSSPSSDPPGSSDDGGCTIAASRRVGSAAGTTALLGAALLLIARRSRRRRFE